MLQGADLIYLVYGIMLVFGIAVVWVVRRSDRLDREEKHPHTPSR